MDGLQYRLLCRVTCLWTVSVLKRAVFVAYTADMAAASRLCMLHSTAAPFQNDKYFELSFCMHQALLAAMLLVVAL